MSFEPTDPDLEGDEEPPAPGRWWRNVRPARVLAHGSRLRDRLVRALERLEIDEGVLLMLLGVAIGVAAGIGVVAFYGLIDLSHLVFVEWLGARVGARAHAFVRPAITAAGLWFAWELVRRSGIAEGQNVPDVQLAVARGSGRVRMRPVVVRTLASAVTLGSGGSAGSEGPVAVLGAATGSALGRVFRFRPRWTKILVGCGAAAGISAAFNAPFAGAFFALEEVLGSFSVGAFGPVVVSSVAGALVVRPFLGLHPAFNIPPVGESRPWTVALLFPVLGVVCGAVSALYVRTYFAAGDASRRLPGHPALRPIVGGLMVGIIVLLSGGILVGRGHLAIPREMFGGLVWYLLVGIALLKIVATAVTLGFGGSGGVFTPTLFIGAALGGGVGRLMAGLLPGFEVLPARWALVGMAGLVAGATRAPLTAIFIVFELTNDYAIVPPLMIVSVVAYAVAKKLSPHGLYDGWLHRRGVYLAHGADRALMERLYVADTVDRDAVSVAVNAALFDIVLAATRTRYTALPVLDADGGLAGMISYEDLRQVLLDRGELSPLLLAADLATPVETVTPDRSLRDALAAMNARGLDVLPVIAPGDGQRYLGLLSRADLLAAYERALVHEI